MAERRMFAKSIVLSDAFLDMPLGARCLYMTMSMLADDDGFVSSPKAIMRQCGASEDDLMVLIGKSFLIPFESGVVVIKHWRINNYLRNDRYKETNYTEEKAQLKIKENGAYTIDENGLGIPGGIPMVYPGKDRLGKDSIDINNNNNSITITKNRERGTFVPPTPMEVKAYCIEKGYQVNAERFCAFYESKGWMVGKNKMRSWKAAVAGWHSREESENKPKESKYLKAIKEIINDTSN